MLGIAQTKAAARSASIGIVILAFAGFLGVSGPASAETVGHSFSGHYKSDGSGAGHTVGGNFYTGSGTLPVMFRGYVMFEIPAGTSILSATLRIPSAEVGNGPNTLVVHEVTTPRTVLLGGAAGLAAYDDFGDGPVYATVTNVGSGEDLVIPLSTEAISAINAARGGTFVVGFDNATVAGSDDYLFAWSAGGYRTLELTRGATVPTMTEWAMIALTGLLAAAGAVWAARRPRFAPG